jgi:hypothetical protein
MGKWFSDIADDPRLDSSNLSPSQSTTESSRRTRARSQHEASWGKAVELRLTDLEKLSEAAYLRNDLSGQTRDSGAETKGEQSAPALSASDTLVPSCRWELWADDLADIGELECSQVTQA